MTREKISAWLDFSFELSRGLLGEEDAAQILRGLHGMVDGGMDDGALQLREAAANKLLGALKTDFVRGICPEEIWQRQGAFGRNELAPEPPASLHHHCSRACRHPGFLFLSTAAACCVMVGFLCGRGFQSLLLAAAICSTAVLVISLEVAHARFLEEHVGGLSAALDTDVTVVRKSRFSQIPARELVVGDILLLTRGDMVPADAAVLQATCGLRVVEQDLTGVARRRQKGIWEPLGAAHSGGAERHAGKDAGGARGGEETGGDSRRRAAAGGREGRLQDEVDRASPALFAGSFVAAGEAKVVVLAVGETTISARRARLAHGQELDPEHDISMRARLPAVPPPPPPPAPAAANGRGGVGATGAPGDAGGGGGGRGGGGKGAGCRRRREGSAVLQEKAERVGAWMLFVAAAASFLATIVTMLWFAGRFWRKECCKDVWRG